MKTHRSTFALRGFTLVEMLVGAAMSVVVGAAVFAVVNAGMVLAARNLSVNLTNTTMRGSLDRAEQLIQQADSLPALIDTAGVPAAGPAAGVSFDSYRGGPYVVNAPASGLPASTTTLTIVRSTNPLASPPLPQPGDLLLISNTPATLRPRVAVVAVAAPDGLQHQAVNITLSAALGTPVTFVAGTILTAKLVRPAALLALPAGGKRELRYYPLFDTTTNLNAPAQYVMLTDQVGMLAEDATPFTLVAVQGRTFVNLSLRVRAANFDRTLAGRQADEFNTFARVDCILARKLTP